MAVIHWPWLLVTIALTLAFSRTRAWMWIALGTWFVADMGWRLATGKKLPG